MDRMELKKRWLMGNIHPELFYLPWGHKKDLCRVYIYCDVYSIDNKNPDLETAKKNGVNPQQNYGFMIFDKNKNIVAQDSFCIPLPVGVYYAVQYKEVGHITSKISYEQKVLVFEVKRNMKELIIHIDGTTRVYYVKAKFKKEACIETKVRNWVTQNVSYIRGDGATINETRVVDLAEANFAEGGSYALNDYSNPQTQMQAESEIPYGHVGNPSLKESSYNTYNKSSFTLYPNVVKHRSVENNSDEKYKVYFDIVEKNNNFQCEDYTYNITSDLYYNHYSVDDYANNTENTSISIFKSHTSWWSDDEHSTTVNKAYGSQFIPADRTWVIRNGWFVDSKGNIEIGKQTVNRLVDRDDVSSANYYNRFQLDNSFLPFSTTSPDNNTSGHYHCHDYNMHSTVHGYVGLSSALIYDVPAGISDSDILKYGVGRYSVSYHFNFYAEPPKEFLPSNIDITYTGDELQEPLYNYLSNCNKTNDNVWRNFDNNSDKNYCITEDKIMAIIDNQRKYDSIKSEDSISYQQFRNNVQYYYLYGLCNSIDYNNTYILWGNFFVSGDELYDYGYITNTITMACNRWGIYKQRNIILDTSDYSYKEIEPSYVVVHYTPISYFSYFDEGIKQQFKVFERKDIDNYFEHIYDGKSLKTIYTSNEKSSLFQMDSSYHDFDKNTEMYGNRLILYIDETVNIPENEYKDYQKGIYSDNLKEIITKENTFMDRLNFLQQEYIRKYKEQYGKIPITELPKKDGD